MRDYDVILLWWQSCVLTTLKYYHSKSSRNVGARAQTRSLWFAYAWQQKIHFPKLLSKRDFNHHPPSRITILQLWFSDCFVPVISIQYTIFLKYSVFSKQIRKQETITCSNNASLDIHSSAAFPFFIFAESGEILEVTRFPRSTLAPGSSYPFSYKITKLCCSLL